MTRSDDILRVRSIGFICTHLFTDDKVAQHVGGTVNIVTITNRKFRSFDIFEQLSDSTSTTSFFHSYNNNTLFIEGIIDCASCLRKELYGT